MMEYKGIAVPVQRPDNNEGIIRENKIIESVSFDPFVVKFECGLEMAWGYSKEQWDVFIDSLKYPSIENVVNEFFKGKEILIGYEWRKITKYKMENSVLHMMCDGKEVQYCLSDLHGYKLRDDLHNSKS